MNITAQQVADEARRIATEDPHHVYMSPTGGACLYLDDVDTPGCIVGHALHNLGVQLTDELNQRGRASNALNSLGIEGAIDVAADGSSHLYTDIGSWLNRVQQHQDHGAAWGRAVWFADGHVSVEAAGLS